MSLIVEVPPHLSEVEEWRPVPGAGGWYEAGSLGHVRSWRIKGRRRTEPLVLAGTISTHGYRVWAHTLFGKEKKMTVHQAVCRAFHGPAPTGGVKPEVRHLDGDKLNNRADNLAWGFATDNAQDRVRHGTSLAGEKNPFAKLTKVQVARIRQRHRGWVAGVATEYEVSRETVRRVIGGDTWA